MTRLFLIANLLVAFSAYAQEFEMDTIETSAGDVDLLKGMNETDVRIRKMK